jgi:hypothetical protein
MLPTLGLVQWGGGRGELVGDTMPINNVGYTVMSTFYKKLID